MPPPAQSGGRRKIDDRLASHLSHLGNRVLHHEEMASDVDRHHLVEVLARGAQQWALHDGLRQIWLFSESCG
jgi:hypothetical protein